MSGNKVQSYADWFQDQVDNAGLEDIKFTLDKTQGASVRLVQDDVMNIITLVEGGRVTETMPVSMMLIPDRINDMLDNVSVA